MRKIPYSKPYIPNTAKEYVLDSLNSGTFENGPYQSKAVRCLSQLIGCDHIFLTPSCTDALEMAAILIDIKPGDEVILPSYTFVSTANAFVLRGATPVFVDIRSDTLNINEQLIEKAVTPKTKAIVAVHYAGVSCDMSAIMSIAEQYQLYVIEDAAQALNAYDDNQHLGTVGHLSTFSFHHTKNLTSGLGGALIINALNLVDRAKCLYTKGTNRDAFLNGQVDKYTWVDVGSSYMMCDLNAALLAAQLEQVKDITNRRLELWDYYDSFFQSRLPENVRRPYAPTSTKHNAHIYYLLLNNLENRNRIIHQLQAEGIQACFHYIPLHNSPAGKQFGRCYGDLNTTQTISEAILRLPLYTEMTTEEVTYVCNRTLCAFEEIMDIYSG